jgi:hypothetical protein
MRVCHHLYYVYALLCTIDRILDMERKKSVTHFWSRGVASLFVDHFSTLSSLFVLQALRGSVCNIDYSHSSQPSNEDLSIGRY